MTVALLVVESVVVLDVQRAAMLDVLLADEKVGPKV